MILVEILLLAVGFFMLMKGADWFVEGSAGIAKKMGIPQLVIGLTIVAMGTSAPEAAVSINASLKGNAGYVSVRFLSRRYHCCSSRCSSLGQRS